MLTMNKNTKRKKKRTHDDNNLLGDKSGISRMATVASASEEFL